MTKSITRRITGKLKNLVFHQNIQHRKPKHDGPPQLTPDLPTPSPCKGIVVVTGLGSYGFGGYGKVRPEIFFPPFVYALHKAGIQTAFIDQNNKYLEKYDKKDTCVVHIYNEENDFEDRFLRNEKNKELFKGIPNAAIVFNKKEIGLVLQRKDLTNHLLSKAGILVPRMIEVINDDEIVFSNAATGTNQEVSIVDRTGILNRDRYNTEFVENQKMFRGIQYFTMVRLLSVGRELIHAYVLIRPDTGSPSVHAYDTPLDPELVEHFQKILVDDRKDELIDLSKRLGDAYGLGFFAHDLLISNKSEQIYVSESNFKFQSDAFLDRLLPISNDLPSHAIMFSSQFPQKSAEAFIRECQRNGCFL